MSCPVESGESHRVDPGFPFPSLPEPWDRIPLPNQSQQPRFAKLMNVVVDDSRIGRLGLLVYLALCRFANNRSRKCWPSVRAIADVARLSPRSVYAGIAELRQLGHLNVDAKYSERGRGSSFYTLNDQAGGRTTPLSSREIQK